jgi:hypothetical protein
MICPSVVAMPPAKNYEIVKGMWEQINRLAGSNDPLDRAERIRLERQANDLDVDDLENSGRFEMSDDDLLDWIIVRLGGQNRWMRAKYGASATDDRNVRVVLLPRKRKKDGTTEPSEYQVRDANNQCCGFGRNARRALLSSLAVFF